MPLVQIKLTKCTHLLLTYEQQQIIPSNPIQKLFLLPNSKNSDATYMKTLLPSDYHALYPLTKQNP